MMMNRPCKRQFEIETMRKQAREKAKKKNCGGDWLVRPLSIFEPVNVVSIE